MKVTISGVEIQLTPEQTQLVYASKKKIERLTGDVRAFTSVLLKYGFKRVSTVGWECPDQICFAHKGNGWWAEILDFKNFHEVWMVGNCLKDFGFPGGANYGSPKEVAEALDEAIANPKLYEV